MLNGVSFNANSRIVGYSYVVASLTGGVWTDYIWADAPGAGNRVAATPAATAAERIAAVVGSGVGTVYYFHTDQVGTTRVVTDVNGSNVADCGQNAAYPNGSFLTYGPFGMPTGCTQSVTPILFTGHELDSESNLSQFQYRKYAALEARWATPDPAARNGIPAPPPENSELLAGSSTATPGNASSPARSTAAGQGFSAGAICPHDPQTWDEYAYVGNSPLSWTDANGLYRCICWNFADWATGWWHFCIYGCACTNGKWETITKWQSRRCGTIAFANIR